MRRPAEGWPEQTAAEAVTAGSTLRTVTDGLPTAKAGREPAGAEGRGGGDGGRHIGEVAGRIAACEGRREAGPSSRRGGPGGRSPPVWGPGGYPPGQHSPGVTPRANSADPERLGLQV